jgi:UDP-N-acetyl-2-amino-2-deoxyglucuronate dehydrogenase
MKVALVGCGRISKRHIEAIAVNNGSLELALLCDNNEDKVKKLSKELKIPYETDMSRMRGMDVITIATPSGMHPKHVVKVAENCDARYIVCEKPVSLTVREVVWMFREVQANGKTLLPVYQNRYNPLVEFIRTTINNGKLGKVHQFNVNVFWNRNDDYYKSSWHGTPDLDGGVLYTQASHYVDMMLYLFGPITDAKGLGGSLRRLDVHDSMSAVCKFENGTVGTLNATVSVFKKNYLTELTIIGEKGTVRLSGTNLNTIDFWDVDGMEKPDMDFALDHIYGKGHDTLYKYVAEEKMERFPHYDDVIAGISLMEKLSF